MDPIVGGALISGGAKLLGNLLGNKSQKDTNAANLQIAQMNNEWSERMMEKQNRMNVEQWEREKQFALEQREYDSAENQAQRFRDAGLNPALMMGSGNAGSAASTPRGGSVGLPSPSSATMQPYNYDGLGNAVESTINQMMALDKHNSDMSALGTNTAINVAMARAKIAQMYEQTRGEKFKNELNDITKDLQITHAKDMALKTISERYLIEEQEKLATQTRITAELRNERMPDIISHEIGLMASQRNLNEFNSSIGIGKFIDEVKKRGIKLDNKMEKTIFGVLAALYGLSRAK